MHGCKSEYGLDGARFENIGYALWLDLRTGGSRFTPTKTGRHGSVNIQKSEEFQISKFYCKTNFDMAEIKAEEEDYANYPLPIAYDFKSVDARERILYMNYNRVKADMNQLIIEIQQKLKVTKIQKQDNKDYAYL